MHEQTCVPAEEALARLRAGNAAYLSARAGLGDVSPEMRLRTAREGQTPYAVVVACSDSRVIPESIFSAGIGELFVVRVAGNVMDDHQLGSIEYACSHLGCRLVVVLGHTHCGAIDAALRHDPSGYVKFITDEIRAAVGEETDPREACRLNVLHSLDVIEQSLDIRREETNGLRLAGAIYDIEDGRVAFL